MKRKLKVGSCVTAFDELCFVLSYKSYNSYGSSYQTILFMNSIIDDCLIYDDYIIIQ
jgi:hypothetical protein